MTTLGGLSPKLVADLERAARIIEAVSTLSGFTVDRLVGPSREAPLAWERHVAMWLIRQHTGLSFPQIGRLFNRDHSTVVHAVRRIGKRARWDEGLGNLCRRVVREVGL